MRSTDFDLHRTAVEFWGDDITAMVMEAQPGTAWFADMCCILERRDLVGIDVRLAGYDIREFCVENAITAHDLADALDVPVSTAYAIGAGWKRLGTRSLLAVAYHLDTPLGAFIHDERFLKRPRVRVYESWILQELAGQNGGL